MECLFSITPLPGPERRGHDSRTCGGGSSDADDSAPDIDDRPSAMDDRPDAVDVVDASLFTDVRPVA